MWVGEWGKGGGSWWVEVGGWGQGVVVGLGVWGGSSGVEVGGSGV